MTIQEIFAVICQFCILSAAAQKIGEIKNLCNAVHVVTLQIGETKEIESESDSQCWRVVGESERNDRLIRATVEDVPPEMIAEEGDYFTCRPQYSYMHQGLLIYDGYDPNINDTLMEKCVVGNATQELSSQTIFSTQPVLFVKWTKKSSGKIKVQLVKLTDAARKCRKSSRRSGQSYIVQSVGYPGDYSSDTFDCWLLSNTDAGTMYEIFIEDIQLANNNNRNNIQCVDKINIYAYPMTKSVNRETDRSSERDIKDTKNIRLLHRFCRNEKSRYLYITERSILITFITNSLRQAQGFKFNIRVVPVSQSTCTELSMDTNMAIGITSPNYPLHYTNGLDMCWNVRFADPDISADYTVSIQNEFQELDPLWIDECPADRGTLYVDRVDIKSSVEPKAKVLASRCGKLKQKDVLVTTSKPFTVRFRSDGFFAKKGFSYQIIPEPKHCVEHFVAIGEGPYELSTGNAQIGSKELCWKLTTSHKWHYMKDSSYRPGPHKIKVDIHSVTLDKDEDCLSSYLRIYDGQSPGGQLLKEYCPNDNTTEQLGLYSTTHKVFIRLKSDIGQQYSITVEAIRDGIAVAKQRMKDKDVPRCSYEWADMHNKWDYKWDDSIYILVSGWMNDLYNSGCGIYKIRDPEPNTQILMKVNFVETSFGGRLAGNCMKNYVVIHDGKDLDAPPIMNVCHDIIDGYIVSSGPALAFLAISEKGEEWFKADTKHVIGGRYGDECISVPIIDSEKYFISSPNHPHTHSSVVDMCWIAYLKEEDKGKRLIFKTKTVDYLYSDACKKAKTTREISLYNDKNELLEEADFCRSSYLNMETEDMCPYSEYLKIRFSSTGPPVTTGFYGYFQAVDKDVACKDAPRLITRGTIILILIAIAFFIIIILCILKNYNWGRDWCKQEAAQQSTETTDGPAAATQEIDEQSQIARVSEPPSYSHVVENNEQFPINRAANSASNGLPSYDAAANTSPSQSTNAVSYKPDNPEQVNIGEGSPMLRSSEA